MIKTTITISRQMGAGGRTSQLIAKRLSQYTIVVLHIVRKSSAVTKKRLPRDRNGSPRFGNASLVACHSERRKLLTVPRHWEILAIANCSRSRRKFSNGLPARKIVSLLVGQGFSCCPATEGCSVSFVTRRRAFAASGS